MNQKIKEPAHECSYDPAANLQPGISKCRSSNLLSCMVALIECGITCLTHSLLEILPKNPF